MQFIEQEYYYDSFTARMHKPEWRGGGVVYFHAVRKFKTFYDKIGSNIHWKSPPTSHLLTVTET